MDVISLSCNKCGAPLEVPSVANFVTCSYCGSRLAVHKSGAVAYTEVLTNIDHKASKMVEHLEELVALNRRMAGLDKPISKVEYAEVGWRRCSGGIEFYAITTGTQNSREIGVSAPMKQDLRNVGKGRLIPKETTGSTYLFRELVRSIESQGWQEIESGPYWFSKKFRSPTE